MSLMAERNYAEDELGQDDMEKCTTGKTKSGRAARPVWDLCIQGPSAATISQHRERRFEQLTAGNPWQRAGEMRFH